MTVGSVIALMTGTIAVNARERTAVQMTAKEAEALDEGLSKAELRKLDKLGPIMAAIGGEAAALVGGDPDGVFLYVEIVDGQPMPFLFRDERRAVRRYQSSPDLEALIARAWRLEHRVPARRWVSMVYEVEGAMFDTDFVYADQLPAPSPSEDRMTALLRARFGDKRVVMTLETAN